MPMKIWIKCSVLWRVSLIEKLNFVPLLHSTGRVKFFEGCVQGTIIDEKRGIGGFGYDPIFVLEGYEKTFAELTPEVKNKIGHRGKALLKMVSHLKLLLRFLKTDNYKAHGNFRLFLNCL